MPAWLLSCHTPFLPFSSVASSLVRGVCAPRVPLLTVVHRHPHGWSLAEKLHVVLPVVKEFTPMFFKALEPASSLGG